MKVYDFSNTNLIDIVTILKDIVKDLDTHDILEFIVLNPDIKISTYSGNIIKIDNKEFIYRSYQSYIDLAQSLKCKFLTPKEIDNNFVKIRLQKLDITDSFHTKKDIELKYGTQSIFSKIYKNEESSFLIAYLQALLNVDISKRKRVLNLGVNSADEFEVIKYICKNFQDLELVGIDYCQSAIDEAKVKFKDYKNINFFVEDINNLNSLNLGKFDLVISIGTLQSSNLNFNPLFMSIVQNQLKKDGAMILGFPNCRWIDGEMIYGAKVKNYNFSEMGLLYKDVIFCKKYLQQKRYRVTITGKDYIFLTATSIR